MAGGRALSARAPGRPSRIGGHPEHRSHSCGARGVLRSYSGGHGRAPTARGRPCPRTPLAGPNRAALQPVGAPEGAAAGLLALRPLRPGWAGGPGHRDGSVRGRGLAPTPNSAPPPLGGGMVGRRM